MKFKNQKVLFIGYGNPGRLDDGLGPQIASAIEKLNIPGLTVDSNYQLNIEDSLEIANHDIVIFADASVNCESPFVFREIIPENRFSFTSHNIEPETLMLISNEMFKSKTKGYILGIRGYEFNDFGENLSPRARYNLEKAMEFIKTLI